MKRKCNPAVLLMILAIFTFSGCSDSKGAARVTIDLGFTEHNISMLDRALNFFGLLGTEAHAAAAPSGITDITLTVSAEDMRTIETSIPADTGYLTLEVPAGTARTFTVSASGGDREYTGTQTADLAAGEAVQVEIQMEAATATFIINSAVNSSADCEPESMVMDSAYIYITGSYYEEGRYVWRIEKRDKVTGALVTDFGTGGVIISGEDTNSTPYSIAVDSHYIYIAGIINNSQWRIEMRSKNTGGYIAAFDSDGHVEPVTGTPYCLAVDADYIYTGGADRSTTDPFMEVEKRNKTDGALYDGTSAPGTPFEIGYFTEYIANQSWAISLTVSSGYLYIAGLGYPVVGANNFTRLEKRDAATGETDTSWSGQGYIDSDSFESYSIAVNSSSVFAAGSGTSTDTNSSSQWQTQKHDITDGTLVTAFGTDGIVESNPTDNTDGALSIALDSGYIYVAGYETAGGEDYQWRVEKRNITTGAYDTGFGSNGCLAFNPASGVNTPDQCNVILADDTYIYLAGSDNSGSSGNARWRIDKRLKSTGGL